MDHKTSHKAHFFNLDLFPLMYGLLGSDNIWPRYNYLKIWNLKKKSKCKVVQIKFLVMHINNKKIFLYIFMVGNVQKIFMEHILYLIS